MVLVDCNRLDITPIASCTMLLQLLLGGNKTGCPPTDLRPLANCCQLQVLILSLRRCEQLQDLKPLAKLVELREIDLELCESMEDLSALKDCVKL